MRRISNILRAAGYPSILTLFLLIPSSRAQPRDSTVRSEKALVIGYESLLERYRQFQPADSSGETQTNDPVLALDGLVVDETRTHMGRDFYDVFYRTWEAPEGVVNQTVRIRERPSPGRGTLVSVVVHGETRARVRLQPRYAFIERIAQQAARYVHRRLQQQPTNNRTP